jgi:hypothetical protein
MTTDKVILTAPEAEWLSRNIIKTKVLLEAKAKKDAGILERKTYRTVASLIDQATDISEIVRQLGSEPYEIEFTVKRKQRGGVAAMIDLTLRSLEERILPEYKKRGLKDYEDDVQVKIGLLKAMAKKFK